MSLDPYLAPMKVRRITEVTERCLCPGCGQLVSLKSSNCKKCGYPIIP